MTSNQVRVEMNHLKGLPVGRRFVVAKGKIALPKSQCSWLKKPGDTLCNCKCHKCYIICKCCKCCKKDENAESGTTGTGCCTCCKKLLHFCPFLKTNLLIILTLLGVGAGFALGYSLRCIKNKWSVQESMYIGFPGEIFLRALQALILPLIVASVISVIGSMDLSLSIKIGKRTLWFFLVTTLFAVTEGIVLVWFIKPGSYVDLIDPTGSNLYKHQESAVDAVLDLLRNMFPPNLIQATIQTYSTYDNATLQGSDSPPNYEHGTNVLGLVVFSTVLGIVIRSIHHHGIPLLAFAVSLGEATMILASWIIWASPIGICFLIAAELARHTGDQMVNVLKSLGLYMATAIAGMIFHGAIILLISYTILTQKSPFKFLIQIKPALVTALLASSSNVSLPITIKCLEENCGIDPRVTRFVLPIAAMINLGGAALYEAVAAIWISQMLTHNLDLGKIIAISVTAAAASIGVAGIPHAGLVTMVMVLETIGINSKYIIFVVPVDFIIDRFRTVLNVVGDCVAVVVAQHFSKEELHEMGPPEDIFGFYAEGEDEMTININPSRMSLRSRWTSRSSITTVNLTTANHEANNTTGVSGDNKDVGTTAPTTTDPSHSQK